MNITISIAKPSTNGLFPRANCYTTFWVGIFHVTERNSKTSVRRCYWLNHKQLQVCWISWAAAPASLQIFLPWPPCAWSVVCSCGRPTG